jgi:hypothetical protein
MRSADPGFLEREDVLQHRAFGGRKLRLDRGVLGEHFRKVGAQRSRAQSDQRFQPVQQAIRFLRRFGFGRLIFARRLRAGGIMRVHAGSVRGSPEGA